MYLSKKTFENYCKFQIIGIRKVCSLLLYSGRQVVGQVKKVGKSRNFHQKVGIFPLESRKK